MPKLLVDLMKAALVAGLATVATVLIDLYYESHSLGRDVMTESQTRLIKGAIAGASAGTVTLLMSRGL
jgi:hypothetical protein